MIEFFERGRNYYTRSPIYCTRVHATCTRDPTTVSPLPPSATINRRSIQRSIQRSTVDAADVREQLTYKARVYRAFLARAGIRATSRVLHAYSSYLHNTGGAQLARETTTAQHVSGTTERGAGHVVQPCTVRNLSSHSDRYAHEDELDGRGSGAQARAHARELGRRLAKKRA